MNRRDLINEVSERAKLTKKDTEIFVKEFINAISDKLEDGESVQIVDFGTFEIRHRAERKGRNPQTKEEIIIPAKKAVAFKVGKWLKERVNK